LKFSPAANTYVAPSVNRFDGVDFLRGLSILAVILLHINIHLHSLVAVIKPFLPWVLFHFIFLNGGNGVTVFFAISGFLITLTSLRRFDSLARLRPAIFYRIRFARIAPLLLLLLLILGILHLAHVPGFKISPKIATLPQALFAALTFHINWLEASAHGYLPANWDVLWSLSVEEMFYLFFPLLTFFLYRMKRGQYFFIALLLIFVAMGPFARTAWSADNPIWNDSSYLGGMDGIALGCLCALLTDHMQRRSLWQPGRKFLIALQITGVALFLLIALWPPWNWLQFIGRIGLDDTLLPLGVCCIILATVCRGKFGSRFTAPVRWFGRCSYEIYLTHSFIIVSAELLSYKLHPARTVLSLAIWTLSIIFLSAILGGLVARFFSEPMNRLLRGVAPPRAQLSDHRHST
jgi:peptidoglycan/LPS O-acetylase OafA/YrhL